MNIKLRICSVITFLLASVCLAQETYHNEEFGFTIDIPSQWHLSLEDQWPDKVKAALEKHYSFKTLLIFNPSGGQVLRFPSILVQGETLKRTTTSEMIADLEKNGKERLTKFTEYMAKYDLLGKKINQYSVIDKFYDYDSSRYLAISKILYKHNEDGTYVLVAQAKFIGRKRVINLPCYWKGDNPDEFWDIFTELVDSFKFDPETTPKGGLGKITQEIKEVSELSDEQKFNRIWKWGGIILTISIILGFAKMLLARR